MLKKMMGAGFISLFAFGAFASDYDQVISGEFPIVWQPIITISGGPAWAGPGQNQYLYPITPPPPTITYYQYQTQTGALATGEIFFGLQRIVAPGLTGQLGLGLAGASDAKLQGVTTVDGVPNIYSYTYKVNQGRLELKGKLISNYFQACQPYLSGSFGAGFNNSHDYIPISAYPLILPAPWFASHTTVGFSYTLGLGLQTMVSPHWQLGMGYEFADWGKSFLDGDNVNYDGGLSLTHMYSNELLFSIGYVF